MTRAILLAPMLVHFSLLQFFFLRNGCYHYARNDEFAKGKAIRQIYFKLFGIF